MASNQLVLERTVTERPAPAIRTSARCCASTRKIVPKNRRQPMTEHIVRRTKGRVLTTLIPLLSRSLSKNTIYASVFEWDVMSRLEREWRDQLGLVTYRQRSTGGRVTRASPVDIQCPGASQSKETKRLSVDVGCHRFENILNLGNYAHVEVIVVDPDFRPTHVLSTSCWIVFRRSTAANHAFHGFCWP